MTVFWHLVCDVLPPLDVPGGEGGQQVAAVSRVYDGLGVADAAVVHHVVLYCTVLCCTVLCCTECKHGLYRGRGRAGHPLRAPPGDPVQPGDLRSWGASRD